MIRKLKKSFVTVTMLSAALVLVALMGILNLSNYIQRSQSDKEILLFLAENNGSFVGGGAPGEGKRDFGPGRPMTEETPYETRFFSVILDEDGVAVGADLQQIAAVTWPEAVQLAQDLYAAGKTSGRSGVYQYLASAKAGTVMYVFLDCSRTIEAVRTYLFNSVMVTILGLLVLFGLAWGFSGRAIRPIVESYEKQKTFITNAGHELKTPLAVIESSTEVIELEGGESQWTRAIHGQVNRLSTLTQDLIALARMDESGRELVLSEQDLSQIVTNALEPFALLAQQKGLGFQTTIQPDLTAKTNLEALEKICVILADNGIKYTADGGTISFSLAKEGGHILLREENPADGLGKGSQEQLFDRFYRADSSRSSAQPGYGLGLPLARSLVEALGGKITAHSPDGVRLVVTVQL